MHSSDCAPGVAVAPSSPKFTLLGRWSLPSPGASSRVASWCGTSISFLFTGTFLRLRTGPLTERKDAFNGGTPMIACSVCPFSQDQRRENTKTYDCGPSQDITLLDAKDLASHALPIKVAITLIDWASIFELQDIIVDREDSIQPLQDDPRLVRVLVIGDSITAGYSDGSQPIPLGCLNAFPHVARNQIRATAKVDIEVGLVAFPGITLTSPTPEEADDGAGKGMVDQFFHASSWSDELAMLNEKPSIILIALGTNDDAQDVSPERFANSLRSFIDRLSDVYSPSLKHICVLHPFPDFTEGSDLESTEDNLITRDLGSVLSQLRANTKHSITLHEWNIARELKKEHTMDGLHPTVAGHDILGNALARQMVALLNESAASDTK